MFIAKDVNMDGAKNFAIFPNEDDFFKYRDEQPNMFRNFYEV